MAKVFGKSVSRLEDPPLVRGAGRFAADISFDGQLHMRVVRSPFAHGMIRGIDVAAAALCPGVAAVWTAADLGGLPPIDFRDATVGALAAYRQPVLARDRVRYVGEPVAAVFATDAYAAEDAAERVVLDVEELPVLLDAAGPPGVFEPGRSTEAIVLVQEYGDVDAAFAAAHLVVELDIGIGRHSGVPLETRGAIGRYDASRDVLELHGAAKVPHRNRDALARMLGRSQSGMVLHESHVGGGFGVRGELYPEDVLVCLAALRLRRPVKWIEDRREHLMATNHSRQQHHRVRAAVDAAGQVIAIEDDFTLDQGAYVRTHGARVLDMTIATLPGPYRLPNYRGTGHLRLTNKTPAATCRAPGYFESSFVRERLFDAVAERMGVDRIALRRANLIRVEEMPFTRPLAAHGNPVVIDSGDYAGLLDKALQQIGWDGLQAGLRARRAAGECVGAGIAMFVEKGGVGPLDGVRIDVDVTGAVEVVTGGASVGQGFETVMAQICAEALGVELHRVRVTHGQTDRIAYGIGAHASRATVMTGNATHAAARKVRAKALDMAAELLQSHAGMLDIVDGFATRQDVQNGPSISLGELARNLAPDSHVLGGRDPGLSAEGWFRTDKSTHPYGLHIIVARIDRGTGKVSIERALLAFDVGRAVNPMLVEGQLAGGFAQGVGGTLLEEFTYDALGQPLSVSFADYLLPTLHDVPALEMLLTEDAPSPFNPLGIKSAGEAGVNAVAAAIASAVDDALGMPGLVVKTPIRPLDLFAAMKGSPAVCVA